MSQVLNKGLSSNAVDGSKLRLNNSQALRARNGANTGDVSILFVDSSNNVLIQDGTGNNSVDATGRSLIDSSGSAQLTWTTSGLTVSSLSASQVVATDSGKKLTSINYSASNVASTLAFRDSSGNSAFNVLTVAGLNSTGDLSTPEATFTLSGALVSTSIATNVPSLVIDGTTANATAAGSAGIIFKSDVHDNVFVISTQDQTGTVQSASLYLSTGVAVNAPSSGMIFQTGNVSGATGGNTGSYQFQTGQITNSGNANDTGDFTIAIGTTAGAGARGQFVYIDGTDTIAGSVLTNAGGDGRAHWALPSAGVTGNKETFVLSGTDITNQYLDLAHVAKTGTVDFKVKGSGDLLEGALYDYSINYTGGSGGNTRITFLNDLATGGGAALVATDVVQISYLY